MAEEVGHQQRLGLVTSRPMAEYRVMSPASHCRSSRSAQPTITSSKATRRCLRSSQFGTAPTLSGRLAWCGVSRNGASDLIAEQQVAQRAPVDPKKAITRALRSASLSASASR
jgi:hypothetical protein